MVIINRYTDGRSIVEVTFTVRWFVTCFYRQTAHRQICIFTVKCLTLYWCCGVVKSEEPIVAKQIPEEANPPVEVVFEIGGVSEESDLHATQQKPKCI